MHAEAPHKLLKFFPNIDNAYLLAVFNLEQTFSVNATVLYLRFPAAAKEIIDVLLPCRFVVWRIR